MTSNTLTTIVLCFALAIAAAITSFVVLAG